MIAAVFQHAPEDYVCPFCRNVATGEADLPLEIVHRDEDVVVKMNPRWRPRNPGAVLVFPTRHHENIYELPDALGVPLLRAVRSAATAMKDAYGCEGVSTRQHNEPAGDQDVWHFHVHVIPRWRDDALDAASEPVPADPDQLRRRAELLRGAWPTDGQVW